MPTKVSFHDNWENRTAKAIYHLKFEDELDVRAVDIWRCRIQYLESRSIGRQLRRLIVELRNDGKFGDIVEP